MYLQVLWGSGSWVHEPHVHLAARHGRAGHCFLCQAFEGCFAQHHQTSLTQDIWCHYCNCLITASSQHIGTTSCVFIITYMPSLHSSPQWYVLVVRFPSHCGIHCRMLCGRKLPSLAMSTQSILAVYTQLRPSMFCLYVYVALTVVCGFPIVHQQNLVGGSEPAPSKVMSCLLEGSCTNCSWASIM